MLKPEINIFSNQLSLLNDRDLEPKCKRSVRQKIKSNKSITFKYHVNCCDLLITINFDNVKIHSVFVHTDKEVGGCKANNEANSKMVNLCLQNDIPISKIINQLKDIRCPAVTNSMAKGKIFDALSCPDAICRAMQKLINIENEQLCDLISNL